MRKAYLTAAAAAIAFGALVATDAFAQQSTPAKQKVVYHINYTGGDKDKAYKAALGNIQNQDRKSVV